MHDTKNRNLGHAADTQDSNISGLPGQFSRPVKITFLGAGSGFTPRLFNDVLNIPGEQGGVISLVDIDGNRLRAMKHIIEKLLAQMGKTAWKIMASTDRTEVLKGSDYVVSCIEVSGTDCVAWDYKIPFKYGVDQCIGDTIGPGGLFKGLRTIPVWLEVLRDCEELCPNAIVLNYTNPMAMLCLSAGRTSSMSVVGLCHSVQGTSKQLAEYAGVPLDELEWECAGINHLSWFTRLAHRGRDLYPTLKRKFQKEISDGLKEFEAGLTAHDGRDILIAQNGEYAVRDDLPYKSRDLIRKDMCLHFGAFITESSGHLSEYLPYYRKNEEGRKLLLLGSNGGSGYYSKNWPHWRKNHDLMRAEMLSGKRPLGWKRSWEYASWIIEAREKDAPFRIHGNVMNAIPNRVCETLISNLPYDGCVEVKCLVDGNGVQPICYGALPPHMAALCASNMAVFDLGAQAAIERNMEKAVHALMLDPLTAAVCTPTQIKALTLELFRAQKGFLPGYK